MKYLIIKFGGSVLEQLPPSFYEDIINLRKKGKILPVIVHGGGPHITKYLSQLNIKTTFINGMRVTTKEVLKVVEMVLSGMVNKNIVRLLHQAGGDAIGISGVDGRLLLSSKFSSPHLGYVGKVNKVNDALIEKLSVDYIPVISPIGIDLNGDKLNINGDLAAAAIAKALGGTLCFVSNVPGIYIEKEGKKTILHSITREKANDYMVTGQIKGGMIPKVQAAFDALQHNVPEVVILNGFEHGSLQSLYDGETIGTKIVNG